MIYSLTVADTLEVSPDLLTMLQQDHQTPGQGETIVHMSFLDQPDLKQEESGDSRRSGGLEVSVASPGTASTCSTQEALDLNTEIMQLEPELARAAEQAVATGTMLPLIKEELKYSIQQKRLMKGEEELVVNLAPNSPGEQVIYCNFNTARTKIIQ